ncbi:MAG: hypothetical protein ABJC09_10235 [Terriglobia bacterium]
MSSLLLAVAAAPLVVAAADYTWDGTWATSQGGQTELTLTRTDETVHVKEARDNKVLVEYTCKLDGKECEIRDEGHKAKVSVWVNGAKLVEVRTRGAEITRRRFTPKEGGKLDVEETELSRPGKTETIAYERRS